MSYAQRTLSSGETVIFATRKHMMALFAPFVVCGVLALIAAWMISQPDSRQAGLFFLLISSFFIVLAVLDYKTAEYVVTNRRVILKEGVIRRRATEMFLTKVEGLSIDQGILGRLCGYGTVIVSGTGSGQQRFRAVAHAMKLRHAVHEQANPSAAAPVGAIA